MAGDVHFLIAQRLDVVGIGWSRFVALTLRFSGLEFHFPPFVGYLIDLDHAVIVDVEATTAIRQAEITAQRRMIERTHDRFGLRPERLAADTGYGDARNLSWLVEEQSQR